jgi:hypothetical protein
MSPAYNLDSRTLTSKDGSAVFAEAIGDPSKPAVIFGHGALMSSNIGGVHIEAYNTCPGMCGESAIFDVIFQREDLQQNIYAVRTKLCSISVSGVLIGPLPGTLRLQRAWPLCQAQHGRGLRVRTVRGGRAGHHRRVWSEEPILCCMVCSFDINLLRKQ